MTSKPLTKIPSNRLPAPALFVGPPSVNGSATSLTIPSSSPDKPTRTTLSRQRSLLAPDPSKRPQPPTATPQNDDNLLSLSSNPSAPFIRRQKQASAAADAEASSRAEAIWAETLNTLEEVELSAMKGAGMTVFGSEHSRALEELRKAQIDLAKAWARSEADESGNWAEEQKSASGTDAADLLAGAHMDNLDAGAPAAETGLGDALERSKLEEETERDIELSRQRREANDRYFEKVNRGVLEVVSRLEEVAKAMKAVESESKEIWGDGNSADTASVTTAPSVT